MAFDSSVGLGVVVGAAVGSSFGGAFATVDERLNRTRQRLGQLRPTARAIGAVVQYTRELDALRRKQITAAGAGQDLGAQIRGVEEKLRRATAAARDHGVEIGDAVAQHRRLADEVRRTEGQLERFERRAARQAERQRLLVAGAQVYGAARTAWAPVSAAIEFESVMADVRKVVDFDTAAQFRATSRAVLDLSTRIPMAAAGLGMACCQHDCRVRFATAAELVTLLVEAQQQAVSPASSPGWT